MDFFSSSSSSGGGGGGGGGRVEADRWLEIASKLLAARDLLGCKRFADRAVDADPLLPGADELLAVVDVLISSQSSPDPDPYAILQLPNGCSDLSAINKSYRRLALLLSPSRNPHPGADSALRLVSNAFSSLSKNRPTTAAAASATASEFWTACPYCCHLHQYAARSLAGRTLRCPNPSCRRAFVANEIPSTPPTVPGTDMYYCAWGFFPLGFPNAVDITKNWKPFYPMFPNPPPPPTAKSSPPQPVNFSNTSNTNNTNSGSGRASGSRIRKTTARKKVGAGIKKRSLGVESGIELGPDAWQEGDGRRAENNAAEEIRGININEEVKGMDGMGGGGVGVHIGGGEENMMSFQLDVDSTDELLGNLQNLPFLREEEIPGRML